MLSDLFEAAASTSPPSAAGQPIVSCVSGSSDLTAWLAPAVLTLVVAWVAAMWTPTRARLQRREATIKFWTETYERRMELRRSLPYERQTGWTAMIAELCMPESREAIKNCTEESGPIRKRDADLREYLSLFETLGAGIHAGAFDARTINRLDGRRIKTLVTESVPYIRVRRTEASAADGAPDDEMYAEVAYLGSCLDACGSRSPSERWWDIRRWGPKNQIEKAARDAIAKAQPVGEGASS